MKKKTNKGLIVFIIILLLIALGVALAIFDNQREKNKDYSNNGNPNGSSLHYANEAKKIMKNKKDYIAAVYIEGIIEEKNNTYNQKWLLSVIDNLKYDDNNVAIALYINTPGGGVYEADEVYLSLLDYKSAGKKIYVYMGPIAASGGYYISCAANKIYANRNTLTGSIGVISSQVYDLTELLETLGIESTTIYSGDNKNMGNINEPFTEEQQEIMQAICDECYEQFLGIVVESRKLSYEEGRKLADGRIYTAKQALSNGLIDNISNWNEMIENLSVATTGDYYCNVKTYKYEKKPTFMESLLETMGMNIKNTAAYKVNNAAMPMYIYTAR
jgi:protease-4